MGLLDRIIAPKLKYKEDIPYTYEARIKTIDGDKYNSFYADTICTLVEYLDDNKVDPDTVELYELFKKEEKKLNRKYCVSEQGAWLRRKQLCVAFSERYQGHIHENHCTLKDREREREVCGA